MFDPDDEHGFWYYITKFNPELYFIPKMMGGKAAKDADDAIADLGPFILFMAAAIGVVLLIMFIFS